MSCPVCNLPLHHADRHGVAFASCARCRGVWLSRQALEQIVARSTAPPPRSPGPADVAVRHGDTRHLGQPRARMPRYRPAAADDVLAGLLDP